MQSSPAIGADGTVYVGSYDNNVYALDGQSGQLKWKYITGGFVQSSPAIGADGTVYASSNDGKIYALDGQTGEVFGSFDTACDGSSPTIGSDGTIFAAGGISLFALFCTSGSKLF